MPRGTDAPHGTGHREYRSRAEHQIGSLLDAYGLPFIYEKPTAVVDDGKTKIWYPDFTLEYGILIEYFGVNGSESYRVRTRHKLDVYEKNQITVLPVYPHDLSSPRWETDILNRIDRTLERRLNDYRIRVSSTYGRRPASYGRNRRY